MERANDRRSRHVPTGSRLVWEPRDGRLARRPDELAVEEPLEIRLSESGDEPARALTVTMRTPGHDFELSLGWLLAEGIITSPGDVGSVRYCADPSLDGEQRFNIVTVDLKPPALARLASRGGALSRLAVTSSSCGVCGTASIEVLSERGFGEIASGVKFALEDLLRWPELLRSEGQAGFAATGGLHGAGLVSRSGELLVAREDIGRHNAVDKVVGWAILQVLEGRLSLPLSSSGLVVSGRTSFEIVQKALVVGIPVVAAVSAASNLAARLADEQGQTLVGFVRGGSCTVYSHPERLSTRTEGLSPLSR